MRWLGQRESENVEDRRGSGVPGRGIALGGGGILLVVVLALVTGQDPLQVLNAISGPSVSVDTGPAGQVGAPSDELGKFAATVLGSTEDVWARVLPSTGHQYERPALADLHAALDERATDSPLFEAAIALGAHPDLPAQIKRLEPAGADLLGVQGITLLVVRPDGYIGMRCDGDHLGALERYRTLVHAGHP